MGTDFAVGRISCTTMQQKNFKNGLSDPRWMTLVREAQQQKAAFDQELKQQEEESFQRKEPSFMLKNFEQNHDRKVVWINAIEIK